LKTLLFAADGLLLWAKALRAHNEGVAFMCTKALPSLHPDGDPGARRKAASNIEAEENQDYKFRFD